MTLQVEGLRFAYPGHPEMLCGVDLRVEPGRCGVLLGPSGCGKSTLLRCIAGLEDPTAGAVRWDGAPLASTPVHARRIGFVTQEPALFPHLNAWQNVAFSFRYQRVPRQNWQERADAWLDRVGLDGLGGRAVDALSGGQRQRVALARTLAAAPRVVLLDEPLSALDQGLRRRVGDDIRELLAAAGVAALWVTHDEEEARRLADHVWRLEDGRAAPAVVGGAAEP